MAERDQFYESHAGFVIAFPRAPQIVAAGLIAPLAVLWIAATGPPLNFAALSGEWGAASALTAAVMAVATILVAAVGLVAADWSAEIKSRKDWAAIRIAADDHAMSAAVPAPVQRDQPYSPVANDDALCAVLRAHRHAAPSNAPKPVIDIRGADGAVGTLMSVRSNALPPAAAPVVCGISQDERTGTAGGSVADAIASRRVSTADRAKHEALHVRAAIGLTAVQSKPWQLKVMVANRRAAGRTRLAGNDGPWAGWPGSYQRSAPHAVPIKVVADIIILGQGTRGQSGGERPPCAQPSGCALGTGVSTRASIVGSAAPDQRHHPPAAIKSLQPEVSFEAQRQLIALAEALARQAAREDDAAEHLAERSRSPPNDPVEILPGGGAKEDTG